MSFKPLRPWGYLWWLLDRFPKRTWDFYGSLSTEERCLSTWNFMNSAGILGKSYLACINDPPSQYKTKAEEKIAMWTDEYIRNGGSEKMIIQHELFEQYSIIVDSIKEFMHSSGNSLILDISSLPKRYFYPILKTIINSEARICKDLIVTYTVPEKYSSNDLAEKFGDWKHIPLFKGPYPEPVYDLFIIGIGYLPMRLPERKKELSNPKVEKIMLLPFPPGPPHFQKNWRFARKLMSKSERIEVINVSKNNASDVYDHLLTLTDYGKRNTVLAPYGPKPLSLAMCIYASLKTNVSVYYTQPHNYNPDYSTGVSYIDNNLAKPEILAYCIRFNGKEYY